LQLVEQQGAISEKHGFWCKNGAETVQFSSAVKIRRAEGWLLEFRIFGEK